MIRRGLYFPILFLSTLFFSSIAIVGGLLRARKELFDWVHRNWSRSLLWAAGVTVIVEGLENVRPETAQVFVSNHQSGLDIWALMAGLPASLRFVAKKELTRVPIFGAACRSAGHVFIDRANPAEAGAAIRKAGERMRAEGLSLFFFPEGTRSSGGPMRRFKRGSFTLAIETGADLVPIALDGGGKIFASGSDRHEHGTIRIRCGPPIPLREMTVGDREALAALTRETIAAMLSEIRGEAVTDA